jgi:membrane protein required for colicin V production
MRRKGDTDMFDIIVLAVIGILTIAGLFSGMVKQLFGLAGVIGGYILAMRYYQLCSKYLTSFHPGTARVISFVVIFLACIVVAHIIGWLVGKLFSISGLGFLNRIGGGLLGFVKGCLIVCVVVIILNAFFPADTDFYKGSYTIKYIQQATAMFKKVSREEIRDTYNEKVGKGIPLSPKKKGGNDPAR